MLVNNLIHQKSLLEDVFREINERKEVVFRHAE